MPPPVTKLEPGLATNLMESLSFPVVYCLLFSRQEDYFSAANTCCSSALSSVGLLYPCSEIGVSKIVFNPHHTAPPQGAEIGKKVIIFGSQHLLLFSLITSWVVVSIFRHCCFTDSLQTAYQPRSRDCRYKKVLKHVFLIFHMVT